MNTLMSPLIPHSWQKSSQYAATQPFHTTTRRTFPYVLPRRHKKIWLTTLISLSFASVFWSVDKIFEAGPQPNIMLEPPPPDPEFPPSYEDIYEFERRLPQHNVSLPEPEGTQGRYFFPANHVWGLGWNNVLQELILISHLAYATNRSFVFEPYTWDRNMSEEFALWNGRMIPSRIPLNAFVSGPIAGGSFGSDISAPRAVNKEYWDQVCPTPTVISGTDFGDSLGDIEPVVRMERWIEKLNSIDDRCVQVEPNTKQLFDFFVFGQKNVLSLWPTLSHSPILTRFGWSPLVLTAIENNANLIFPTPSTLEKILSTLPSLYDLISTPSAPDSLSLIPGTLALHVRRGDFDEHCTKLALWSSSFMGFTQFPTLPDRFEVPAGGGWGENTPENIAEYMSHCWPSVAQIAGKVAEVLKTPAGKGLRRVFVMTNGDEEWVDGLKDALNADGRWEAIVSSRDLRLTWEQRFIAQAIDMVIAQRAQVFIGNGFSSLSANVVMLRMSKGVPPDSIRFW